MSIALEFISQNNLFLKPDTFLAKNKHKQLLATAHFSMLETTKLEVNQPHHERKEGNVNAAFE